MVAGIYFAIYRRFIVAYAQLQRIDANAKSPLLVHIQESAAGASVLRAYSLMEDWTAKSDRLVDETTRAFNAFNSAGRWLAVRVEAMGALILVCVGFLAWYYDELSASLVGEFPFPAQEARARGVESGKEGEIHEAHTRARRPGENGTFYTVGRTAVFTVRRADGHVSTLPPLAAAAGLRSSYVGWRLRRPWEMTASTRQAS